ncbi:hypothetical protein, partial [Pseudomonas syringae group genomosp. 7]|uniref:hypothetical protein n=1 Tax=Pseudomonas syringae group genomosp. 7 TaxID=251699 RepID=UPI00376FF46E
SLTHVLLLLRLSGSSNSPRKLIARHSRINRILAIPVAGYTLKTTLADELTPLNKRLGLHNPGPVMNTPVTVPGDFLILLSEDNS